MTTMKIGSLFSGYGGLDQAAEAFFDGRTVWTSDIDPGACKILAHRYPGVPNLGDISAVDWHNVEPIDVLTGGFPCQDVSHAGKRAGMRPDTRSGLWSQMAYAASILRPRYIIAENVRGLLSARADSNVEPCPWCVGGAADGEPDLRALGAVLGDLAELGYDARWVGLRAADVGAPHGRFRVFVVATDTRRADGRREDPAGSAPSRPNVAAGGRDEDAGASVGGRGDASDATGEPGSVGDGDDVRARRGTVGRGTDAGRSAAEDTDSLGRERGRRARDGRAGSSDDRLVAADTVSGGWERRGSDELAGAPEHAAGDGAGTAAADADQQGREGRESARGRDLPARGAAADAQGDGRDERWTEPARIVGGSDAAERGASATDANSVRRDRFTELDASAQAGVDGECRGHTDGRGDDHRRSEDEGIAWGAYEPAVRRWERATGRVAPAPTETSPKGSRRLSPRFVEWMMGLPAGWVTDVPGLNRNAQLKALGNGVVPQQAFAGITIAFDGR